MSTRYNTVELNGFRVPATFHDALLKIKDGFEKGNVNFSAAGYYVFYDPVLERNVFDPIGYLLNRKQREVVTEYGNTKDNAISQAHLWKHFGEANLQAMLSMPRNLAARLQKEFDEIATDSHEHDVKTNHRREFLDVLNCLFAMPNFANPALA